MFLVAVSFSLHEMPQKYASTVRKCGILTFQKYLRYRQKCDEIPVRQKWGGF